MQMLLQHVALQSNYYVLELVGKKAFPHRSVTEKLSFVIKILKTKIFWCKMSFCISWEICFRFLMFPFGFVYRVLSLDIMDCTACFHLGKEQVCVIEVPNHNTSSEM